MILKYPNNLITLKHTIMNSVKLYREIQHFMLSACVNYPCDLVTTFL